MYFCRQRTCSGPTASSSLFFPTRVLLCLGCSTSTFPPRKPLDGAMPPSGVVVAADAGVLSNGGVQVGGQQSGAQNRGRLAAAVQTGIAEQRRGAGEEKSGAGAVVGWASCGWVGRGMCRSVRFRRSSPMSHRLRGEGETTSAAQCAPPAAAERPVGAGRLGIEFPTKTWENSNGFIDRFIIH